MPDSSNANFETFARDLPSEMNPLGHHLERPYIQPIMTSESSWENVPTFGRGIEFVMYKSSGEVAPKYQGDWGVAYPWYIFSQKTENYKTRNNVPYLYCCRGNSGNAVNEIKMTFAREIKMKSFSFQQIKTDMGWVVIQLLRDGVDIGSITVPNITTLEEQKQIWTIEVPEENQGYSRTYSLKQVNAEKGWANGCTFLGYHCKINAVW